MVSVGSGYIVGCNPPFYRKQITSKANGWGQRSENFNEFKCKKQC